jgi:hypothetical protein
MGVRAEKKETNGRIAIRAVLVALAILHGFPATKHLGLFVAHPSLEEGWKGFGAALAVALYLLPLRLYVRALGALWSRARGLLVLAGWVLAAVHAVPAADHLPKLVAQLPTFAWGDAWRGVGAALACAWFLAPLRVQAVALRALRPETFVVPGEVWMDRAKVFVIVVLGLILGVGLGARAMARRAPPPSAGPELVVPRATGVIALDGDLDEPAWAAAARTGAFTMDGALARPYSDARLLWRGDVLYVALYAADEDIRASAAEHDAPLWTHDAFQLSFRAAGAEHVLDVSPLGVVTDGVRAADGSIDYRWESLAKVGHEADGTVDVPGDDDEEWVLEMAIPLGSLGLEGRAGERVSFSVRRCDATRQVGRVCAGWGDTAGGVLVLGDRNGG